jgi:hypothetical protein
MVGRAGRFLRLVVSKPAERIPETNKLSSLTLSVSGRLSDTTFGLRADNRPAAGASTYVTLWWYCGSIRV